MIQEKRLKPVMPSKQSSKRRILQGVIVSDKMQKTVVVRVTRLKLSKKYKKYYRRSKKYKAHDPEEKFKVGDKVTILEVRPISKEKGWRVI